MKKKTKVIIAICAAAVLLGGGAAVWILLGTAGGDDTPVYVSNVGELLGLGSAGLQNRYAGVVEAQDIIKYELDPDKDLDETFVEVGDEVNAGDPLFSYDVEGLELAAEQLKLDMEGLENNIKTMNGQIADVEKQLRKATGDNRVELTIQLQTLQLQLRQEEYNLTKKKLEVQSAEEATKNNVVSAETSGVVRSINPPGSEQQDIYGQGQETAYITLMASDDYRVKGTISEQTVYLLQPGMPVLIRSRVDDAQVWSGVIDSINTEQAESSSSQMMYYGMDDGRQQASKYPFYVALEDNKGLMMGQHVYIELDEGQTAQKDGIWLPSYYIEIDGTNGFVYAENNRGRIERRKVMLGEYNGDTDCHEVTAGLSAEDYIAFPGEEVKAGMKAVHSEDGMIEPPTDNPDDLPGDNAGDGDTIPDGDLTPGGNLRPEGRAEDMPQDDAGDDDGQAAIPDDLSEEEKLKLTAGEGQ